MNRTAAAFVAGAALTAAALLYSNLNGPVAAFVAGFLVNLVTIAGVLSYKKNLRRTAELMTRIAGVERAPRTAKTAAPVASVSPVEIDVTDALLALKVKKATAAAAAARAIAQAPTATFEEAFRIALPFAKA